jgi:signal transduction histidine kinase
MKAGGGRVEGLRTEVLDKDGDRVPVSLSAALLYEEDEPIGSVGIFTDLREKMRMEQRLAQAQEQILAQERQAIVAELAGAAAHELNQPLTSVMGYAEMLKRRLDPTTAPYSAAEIIFNEAERMAEIVRKIGKITRYETKSYVGRARILDLDRSAPSSTPHVEEAMPQSEEKPLSSKKNVANERGE